MSQRVFKTVGEGYDHRWIVGEGCRFPEGDYVDTDGHISSSIYNLEELLTKVRSGRLVELFTIDPDLEVDEGL